MQEKNCVDVKIIIKELCNYLNVKNVQGLARYLAENPNKIYGWTKQGNIADTGCILDKCPNIRKEWLETGKPPMLRETDTEPMLQAGATSNEPAKPEDLTGIDEDLLKEAIQTAMGDSAEYVSKVALAFYKGIMRERARKDREAPGDIHPGKPNPSRLAS